MSVLERSKKIVVDYQTTYGGSPEKAVADRFAPRNVQHAPDASIGFRRRLLGEDPALRLDTERVIAESDITVSHFHLVLEPGKPLKALADCFHRECGDVVDEWGRRPRSSGHRRHNNGLFQGRR